MKHKVIIILSSRGCIDEIHTSGDTDIVIEGESFVSRIEPDSTFQENEGHKVVRKKHAKKLKEWQI
jgi:hypothetical protein